MFEDQTATTRAAPRRRELFPEPMLLTAHLVMFAPQTRAVQAVFEPADL